MILVYFGGQLLKDKTLKMAKILFQCNCICDCKRLIMFLLYCVSIVYFHCFRQSYIYHVLLVSLLEKHHKMKTPEGGYLDYKARMK